ncbi:MAG: winged helix-turn-helix transcriptional regulator [Acidimicrobiia bacterium]|nr:winged helix-turn-helix transcriptional regulator [Acidimicrobiia bacterium]
MANEESVFKALASPVRREILFHLRQGELSAGDIAGKFDIAAPTISRHLGVLKGAGLVSERRDSNRILYSAAQEEIAATLTDFLGAVCPTQQVQRRKATRKEQR